MTLESFIAFWLGAEGGAERANYARFLDGLIEALDLPIVPPGAKGALTPDYGYEARVAESTPLGTARRGRVDLYKRGCFIIEAKQSHLPPGAGANVPLDPPAPAAPAPPPVLDLFGKPIDWTPPPTPPKPRGRAYDRLMEDALAQARGYALALPADHGWPPFLIVCDVGRAFELFFDWAGNGKGYGFFPDQTSYRIELEDLRKPKVQTLLRGIWTDPASVDPRLRAVEVTREIATRLATVSKQLETEERQRRLRVTDEERSLGIEQTALFLMRVLFCMFAEDVDLLPKGKFKAFIADALDKSDTYWMRGLTDLWERMNRPGKADRYWSFGDAFVLYFNGNLFAEAKVFGLPREQKGELLRAAESEWKDVEPAIFGTLLEQAITEQERAKLGAHYTPRAYVERLVDATIMDVLRPEWAAVRGEGRETPPALDDVLAFHDRLVNLRVLDPACGTGNFLYVAMENLLRMESDVLELIRQLGSVAVPRIGPNQFLGIELNPRAAVIAELVLWIGWLRYRLANDPNVIGEPVLPPLHNINEGQHGGRDALLAADPHTGAVDLSNPRAAIWPEADFIVGNPPFIGKGATMREALTDEYVEAIWAAHADVPHSADLVMFWWNQAAKILATEGSKLRRFGLVTTNSVTGSFNRRVVARHLENGISLCLAIPDHPWTQVTTDAADVRIAMTVAGKGVHSGQLIEITGEENLNSDVPLLHEHRSFGPINANLTIGTDVTSTVPLQASSGLACNGMMLAGQGFKLTSSDAQALIAADGEKSTAVVRPYVGGGELLRRPQGRFVIDLFGLAESTVRSRFPRIYQHLLVKVKPERDKNRDVVFSSKWWQFGRPRPDLRHSLIGLRRFIGTTETSKHRVFQFINAQTVPDHMVVAIASDDAFHLGVLSSSAHCEWALSQGGTLEDRPRYNKTLCFDPFPFPDAAPPQRERIAELAEELDLTRRVALEENADLTMTGLYNMVAEVRSGAALTPAAEAAAVKARARIVAKLHSDLDTAVAAAYGWPADLSPADIVTRLVALNAERAAEEAAGHIRWLRPDYQAVS